MRDLKDCIVTEALVEGVWVHAHWEQLEAGDVVRMMNFDGTPLSPERCRGFGANLEPMVVSEALTVVLGKI